LVGLNPTFALHFFTLKKPKGGGTVYHPTDDENDIAVNTDIVDLETE